MKIRGIPDIKDERQGRRGFTVLNKVDVNVVDSIVHKESQTTNELLKSILEQLLLIRIHLEIITGEDIKNG